MYGYEWTAEYGIFRLTIDAKIQKEIRPVFHEELDFFGMDQYWDYPKDTDNPLLWAEGIRRYVIMVNVWQRHRVVGSTQNQQSNC